MNKRHLKGNSSSIRFIFQAKNKGLKASPPKRKFQRAFKKKQPTERLKVEIPSLIQNIMEHNARQLLLVQSQQGNFQSNLAYQAGYNANKGEKRNKGEVDNSENQSIEAFNYVSAKENSYKDQNINKKTFTNNDFWNKNIKKRSNSVINNSNYTLVTCQKKKDQEQKITKSKQATESKLSLKEYNVQCQLSNLELMKKSNNNASNYFFPNSIHIDKNRSLIQVVKSDTSRQKKYDKKNVFKNIQIKLKSSYLPSKLNDKILVHLFDVELKKNHQYNFNNTKYHSFNNFSGHVNNRTNFKNTQRLSKTGQKLYNQFNDVFCKDRSATLDMNLSSQDKYNQNLYYRTLKCLTVQSFYPFQQKTEKMKSLIVNCNKKSGYEKFTKNKEKISQNESKIRMKFNNKSHQDLSNRLQVLHMNDTKTIQTDNSINKQKEYLCPIFYTQSKC